MKFKVGDKVKINLEKVRCDAVFTVVETDDCGCNVLDRPFKMNKFIDDALVLVGQEEAPEAVNKDVFRVKFDRYEDVVRVEVLNAPKGCLDARFPQYNSEYSIECGSAMPNTTFEDNGKALVIGYMGNGKTSFCYSTPEKAHLAIANFARLIRVFNSALQGDVVVSGAVETSETVIVS